MIITPMSEAVFKDPFSLKEKQENQELLPNYSRTIAVNNSEDTIHFSETSLAKLQEASPDNKDQQSQGATFLYNKNGERVHSEAQKGDLPIEPMADNGIAADDQTIESIRKQIRMLEKKISKIQSDLDEALGQVQDKKSGVELKPTATKQSSHPASELKAAQKAALENTQIPKETKKNDAIQAEKAQNAEATKAAEIAGAPVAPELVNTNTPSPTIGAARTMATAGASEADAAATVDTQQVDAAIKAMVDEAMAQTTADVLASELKSLNAQVLNLNNKLAEAIKNKMGGLSGPPGAAGGTRAEGFGGSLT